MREVERRFRQADVFDCVRGGVRDQQRLRVGEPDVFTCEDHQSTRDEPRVLPRVEHAREPVNARVGVGAADRLDERRHDVVVLVVPVVDRAERERGFRVVERDPALRAFYRERVRNLEHGEEVAGVALALVDEMLQRVVVDRGYFVAEAAFGVVEGAVRERAEVVVGERLEAEQRAA